MKTINSKKAFTLVEIMIVVAIIGILSAIAIPNFVKSKETAKKNACIQNMARIRDAEDMWALDSSAGTGSTPSKSDLVPGYLKSWPMCGDTEYEVPAVGSNPECPVSGPGHTLSGSGTTGGSTPSHSGRSYSSP